MLTSGNLHCCGVYIFTHDSSYCYGPS